MNFHCNCLDICLNPRNVNMSTIKDLGYFIVIVSIYSGIHWLICNN